MAEEDSTPKKGANNAKMFSADFVTALYAALLKSNGGKLSIDYKYMSQASGGMFSPSSCDHQLRDIKKRAGQINEEIQTNGTFSTPSKGTKAVQTPTSTPKPSSKKRVAEELGEETPTTKKKKTPQTKSKASDAQPFVKMETPDDTPL